MLQFYTVLKLMVLAFILSACGGGGSSPSSTTPSASETNTNGSLTTTETQIESSSTDSETSTTLSASNENTQTASTSVNSSENTQTTSTSPTTEVTTLLNPSSLNVAVDNTGNTVEKPFNAYTIKVLSDKTLEDSSATSRETIAVYGTINGVSTKALLKINSNYRNSNLIVEVYQNSLLVAQKEGLTLTDQIALDFGAIEIQ